jgi:signal transduction protein with GAF and PtsI domain
MKTERPQKGRMSVLEEISRIITGSRRPEEALDKIVVLVAGKFSTDVCSVYLLDEEKSHLVLRATVGLRKKTVGKIRMGMNEGLTGLVLEKMKPVFVVDPSAHPRYRFFKESGEGLYTTFLGVPLVYHQDVLGVLVVQTVKKDAISKSDTSLFTTIAAIPDVMITY